MGFSYRNWRTLYYLGILSLILNAFPVAQELLNPILSFKLIDGITVIMLIAFLTGIGAYMAFQRKFG